LTTWCSPEATWRLSDYTVGGRLSLQAPLTGDELYAEIIDVLDAPHRLCLRADEAAANTRAVTTYTLAAVSGGTLLTVTFANHDAPPNNDGLMDEDCPVIYVMLENIRALCEETPLPHPEGCALQLAW